MNIYVGNIPFHVTEGELEDAFAAYGDVASVKIIMDRETGRSKGFGFVEMDDDEEGREAIDALNQFEMEGRALKVNEARPRTGGGGGGNFRPRNNFGGGGGRSGGGGGYDRGRRDDGNRFDRR